MKKQMNAERTSDRELTSSRMIPGALGSVFQAWANPEIFQKWWIPKNAPIKIESCQMDIRTGGTYRLVLAAGGQSMAFFGKYLEVVPNAKMVWTNEEGGPEAWVTTTVTFEEVNGGTYVKVSDLYPSKAVLDEAIATDSSGAMPEQLEQLREMLAKK